MTHPDNMLSCALILSAIALMLFASASADAAQFSFDASKGQVIRQSGPAIPVGLVIAASLVGALLIVLERKKAKGIWSSNDKRLR